MPCDYSSIKTDNEKGYGTKVVHYGKVLLADRYADRTHFIFELLQNAEDAMCRRIGWQGSRAVRFTLSKHELRISHFGDPFNEGNVRAICNIAEPTKDLTDIGRFGIGFKSVYAITDMPEVHSGQEDFAIENYVWPTPARPIARQSDETVFRFPLRLQDTTDHHDSITEGLRKIGPQTLLFLRQIDQIAWSVEGGPSGLYLRKPETIGENIRQVTMIGQQEGSPNIEERWLVFSRSVKTDDGRVAGQVEIAFSIKQDKESGHRAIREVSDSPLVVFFPTVLQTHLGFLVQGPYRTTLSRDNVPPNDPWNQDRVKETAALLVEALRSLRDLGFLDVGALSTLPLDRTRFGEGNMFTPMFNAVRDALSVEPLLPRFGGGHVSANCARLAGTKDLRELVSAVQLGALFGEDREISWLSEDITQGRTPGLRQYLIRELGIREVIPESVLPKLSKSFLETQSDEWISRLYEFLNGQPSLRRRLDDLPLIRLADGTHVFARSNGQPQAFLPGQIETGFPTVHRAVCVTDGARTFLQSLGLTEPDPVDDVVRNVLPKYGGGEVDVDEEGYEADTRRILTAFDTDSKNHREKLLKALRDSFFVKATDSGSGAKKWARPGAVYLATERLKEFFEGVTGVLLVDDCYPCLKGEDVRKLLDACGATRYLQPVAVESSLTSKQRHEMRVTAGCENCTWEEPIQDHTLRGLDLLLIVLPRLDVQNRRKRAALLWEALADVEDRRGTGIFSGTYEWTYCRQRSATFDAAFVRRLNESEWVPDADGHLQRPELVIFDMLGWKQDPFLLSKTRFKSPTIETLAREAGIEAAALDLLKKLGVTSEAELKKRLGIKEELEQLEGETEPPKVPPTVDVVPPSTDIKKPPGPGGPVTPPPAKPGSEPPEHPAPPSEEGEPLQLKDPSTAEYELGMGVTESLAPGRGVGGGGAGGGGGGGGGGRTVPLSENEKDEIEKCGRLFAQRLLEDPKLGYIVEQMPPENPGFDLKATREGEELRVEVKAHLRKATVVDDLTARQYKEYVGSKTKGAEYKWELWNIENLKDDEVKVLITRYDDIPYEALDAKLFRVDLKKCIAAE